MINIIASFGLTVATLGLLASGQYAIAAVVIACYAACLALDVVQTLRGYRLRERRFAK